jgi:hypothetical protein
MDAMRVYHGFVNPSSSLEVFWFTQAYGKTMWQSWVPANSSPTPQPTNRCKVSPTVTWQNVTYVVRDCQDWSSVTLASVDAPIIPAWPLPMANLLHHGHFDSADSWNRGGLSKEGNLINWSFLNSQYPNDRAYDAHGVAYLATNCA